MEFFVRLVQRLYNATLVIFKSVPDEEFSVGSEGYKSSEEEESS
jgi:hypothetical protein